MNTKKILITTLLLLIISITTSKANSDLSQSPISDYQVISQQGLISQEAYTAIRKFSKEDKDYLFVVNNKTVKTKIVSANKFNATTPSNNAYKELLDTNTKPTYINHNYGVTNIPNDKNGVFLTIDLCPSSRPMDAIKFIDAVYEYNNHKTVYAVIAITGLWLDKHQDELEALLQLQEDGIAKLTFVNHSKTHPVFSKECPKDMDNVDECILEKGFLIAKEVDFKNEVLSIEKNLINRGIAPSIFFRFPGLVSSEKTILELKEMGLIALSSNAWIAKGEYPNPGSIILVHGNGNEVKGYNDFMEILEKDKGLSFIQFPY
jgi:hypothetical protein